MNEFKEIMESLKTFRNDRDWKQFHNPKDLATAISIEASELQELFLWKKNEELDEVDEQKIRDELADIFSFSFLILDYYGFDLNEIISDKIKKNAKKYPISKSKGTSTKYDELK